MWRDARILLIYAAATAAVAAAARADVVPRDRLALVDLYSATGGPQWRNSSLWNTSAPVCSWYGVTCSRDGSRVTELWVAGGTAAAAPTGLAAVLIVLRGVYSPAQGPIL